jgi:hypothetical protein
MALDPTTVISRNPAIIASRMDDEVVMMNMERGNYYGLNPVAAEIWEMLETPQSIKTICDQLMESFEVDQAQCYSEVITYVEKLQTEGLIILNP